MTYFNRLAFMLVMFLVLSIRSSAQELKIKPVTPNASTEAKALLGYIQEISGNHTLSGQHNFPISKDRNSRFAAEYIGKTPVIWSQDFGFAEGGDKDSYLARPSIIQEAIRQHKLGSIVTLCWHAVPPTAKEPITFQPIPGYDSMKLASVQGKLPDEQFKSVLTPGTRLHKQWIKQVDEIASHLKQLQAARVPVLWRPYHEMNGNWFWWGGRTEGKYTTAALYRQIFDRLAKHHKLNNLIWVWSVDRPSQPGREFVKYFPGSDYLDILSLDVYGNDFNQSYYDGLMALSQGKPLALGEVGNPPALEVLDKQPNWAFWVVWAGMVRNTSRVDYEKLAGDPRVVFQEDPSYINGTKIYRTACGFAPLSADKNLDFTGEWILNEYESKIDNSGPSNTPYKLNVVQKENSLVVRSTSIVEWADDEVTEQTLTLDGKDVHSIVFNSAPRVQHASWTTARDTLKIDSRINFNFGGRPVEIKGKDLWALQRMGKKLIIFQTVQSFRGERKSTLVYDKHH